MTGYLFSREFAHILSRINEFNMPVALSHLSIVPHIVVSELFSIGSVNGLSPIWHQTIIQTKAGLLSIRPLGTNFGEIWTKIQNFSSRKMQMKILSAKWWPFCPGLGIDLRRTTNAQHNKTSLPNHYAEIAYCNIGGHGASDKSSRRIPPCQKDNKLIKSLKSQQTTP